MPSFAELSNLRGRRALVTGAGGHIGRVIAETLAEMGADLILVDRGNAELSELRGRLAAWPVNTQAIVCDLECQERRAALISEVLDSVPNLNILINNAAFVGTSDLEGWGVPFAEQSVETWRRALEVNLTAGFHLCQGLQPLLKASQGANIVNVGSIYGTYGPDWRLYDGTQMSNPAAYGASKGGLVQFSRWLATTVAPEIRVNILSPGGVWRNQPESFVKSYELRTPLGRMAREDDFRGAVAFLASDLSAYVTGQNIQVDGGWGVW